VKKRGVGYASTFYGTGYGNGFPDESRAAAQLNSDGHIDIYVGVADVGQGGISTMWQIGAESLGISKEHISIKYDNTSTVLDSGTAAASRHTYNTGNAVFDACSKLKANMELAINTNITGEFIKAEAKGTSFSNMENIKELDLANIGLEDVYVLMIDNNINTKVEGYFKAPTSQLDPKTGQGNPYWPYSFGTQRVVVEVDDETGKVDVIDIVTVNDAGRIVNPVLAEGQAQGGCTMGIGYAIMEEVEVNKGEIKNRNFSDYIIPTSKDIPKINAYFIEEHEKTGPFGAKGLGEPAMIPTAPAIINAIYDAIGVRIYDLPATCDKILLAIKNKVT
jgi:nicotinate dehydrogenase medium molybdopterin subunit